MQVTEGRTLIYATNLKGEFTHKTEFYHGFGIFDDETTLAITVHKETQHSIEFLSANTIKLILDSKKMSTLGKKRNVLARLERYLTPRAPLQDVKSAANTIMIRSPPKQRGMYKCGQCGFFPKSTTHRCKTASANSALHTVAATKRGGNIDDSARNKRRRNTVPA